MNYLKKIFPVFMLSRSLIFVGVSAGSNAEAATTITSLTKTVNSLSAKIKVLESKLNSSNLAIEAKIQLLSDCVDQNIETIVNFGDVGKPSTWVCEDWVNK